jgi:hypothetical protein
MGVATSRQCPLWVKRVGFVMSAICPVNPRQQTFPGPVGTSHLCQGRYWHVVIWLAFVDRFCVSSESPT